MKKNYHKNLEFHDHMLKKVETDRVIGFTLLFILIIIVMCFLLEKKCHKPKKIDADDSFKSVDKEARWNKL